MSKNVLFLQSGEFDSENSVFYTPERVALAHIYNKLTKEILMKSLVGGDYQFASKKFNSGDEFIRAITQTKELIDQFIVYAHGDSTCLSSGRSMELDSDEFSASGYDVLRVSNLIYAKTKGIDLTQYFTRNARALLLSCAPFGTPTNPGQPNIGTQVALSLNIPVTGSTQVVNLAYHSPSQSVEVLASDLVTFDPRA